MNMKQVPNQDILSNLLIRSKKFLTEGIKYDHKLNYKKVYDNPKEYQVSYVEAIANLEQIKTLFKKRINDKNPHYNFFLDDDDDNIGQEKQITTEEYERYVQYLKRGKIFAYTLKNTWTKGKQFYYITKGCVLQVVEVYEDRIFVDVAYKGLVGLMKLNQLKIILTDDDDS